MLFALHGDFGETLGSIHCRGTEISKDAALRNAELISTHKSRSPRASSLRSSSARVSPHHSCVPAKRRAQFDPFEALRAQDQGEAEALAAAPRSAGGAGPANRKASSGFECRITPTLSSKVRAKPIPHEQTATRPGPFPPAESPYIEDHRHQAPRQSHNTRKRKNSRGQPRASSNLEAV